MPGLAAGLAVSAVSTELRADEGMLEVDVTAGRDAAADVCVVLRHVADDKGVEAAGKVSR